MIAFSPFRRAVFQAAATTLHVHEPRGTRSVELPAGITAQAPSIEGCLLATGGVRPAVWWWRADDGAVGPLCELPEPIRTMSCSPSGRTVVGSGRRTFVVTRSDSGEIAVNAHERIECATALPDGRWVELGAGRATVRRGDDVETVRLPPPSTAGAYAAALSLGEPGALVAFVHGPPHTVVQQINLQSRSVSASLLLPLAEVARHARS